MTRRSKKRRFNTHGVYPSNHPKSIRDKIDYDYLSAPGMSEPRDDLGGMTPKEWLAKFTDEAINGKYRNDGSDLIKDPEQRRAVYRDKNHANQLFKDAMAVEARVYSYGISPPDVATLNDLSPTPAFLENADYKTAREEMRRAIDAKDKATAVAWQKVLQRFNTETTTEDDEMDS